jgi:hypothetical protein
MGITAHRHRWGSLPTTEFILRCKGISAAEVARLGVANIWGGDLDRLVLAQQAAGPTAATLSAL